MKIYSWNVNGFRSILKKGFLDYLNEWNPDILCLQEVKMNYKDFLSIASKNNLDKAYHTYWHNGTKPGYSGVAVFSKQKANTCSFSFFKKIDLFEDEGRILILEFQNWVLLNIYFPNGQPRKHESDVLKYKILFYDHFLEYMDYLKAQGKFILACGDYNIAHYGIDLARPEENLDSIGFLPEERVKLDQLVARNYVDVFRHFYPNQADTYTWWSYRTRSRERNVGWRLDYFFLDYTLLSKVEKVDVLSSVYGSDHCPIFLALNF